MAFLEFPASRHIHPNRSRKNADSSHPFGVFLRRREHAPAPPTDKVIGHYGQYPTNQSANCHFTETNNFRIMTTITRCQGIAARTPAGCGAEGKRSG